MSSEVPERESRSSLTQLWWTAGLLWKQRPVGVMIVYLPYLVADSTDVEVTGQDEFNKWYLRVNTCPELFPAK